MGCENIELISDASFEDWEHGYKRTKHAHPDGILIGSMMESFEKGRWQELAGRCFEAGCDAQELNFSGPHGHPDKGMGAAMGQDPGRVALGDRRADLRCEGRGESCCCWVRSRELASTRFEGGGIAAGEDSIVAAGRVGSEAEGRVLPCF